MDTNIEKQRLEELINKTGEDMANLSKVAGKNHSYIYQFLKRGSPRRLPEDVRDAIEEYFNKPSGYLRGRETQNKQEISYDQPQSIYKTLSDKVPVYGYVAGSTDKVAVNDGNIIGMRSRGPSLTYAKDGFYVMVIGESMEPRLRPGEYVAVNPALPPLKGDECVVEYINGEAIVKTFVSQDANQVTVTQYNPQKTIKINLKEVVSVNPVIAIEKNR